MVRKRLHTRWEGIPAVARACAGLVTADFGGKETGSAFHVQVTNLPPYRARLALESSP